MRFLTISVALSLAAIGAGCSANASDGATAAVADPSAAGGMAGEKLAPLTPFVPPSPAGCAAAVAYDGCFAFDGATPLAVNVTLPEMVKKGAIMVVRFHLLPDPARAAQAAQAGAAPSKLVVDHTEFRLAERREHSLYFQVFPGAYQIEIGVDTDGDGNPDGPNDAKGWSSIDAGEAVTDQANAAVVAVADAPVSTTLALAQPTP